MNPLGLFHYYDSQENKTHLQWSYMDSDALTHFEIEVYDENLRKWVKFDGRNGIVQKQAKVGSNY